MSWKKNEKQLFDYLKSNYIPDLKWSDGQYAHHDCYSLQYECDIELKCRNKHYDELLIEKYKYDKLLARAQKHLTIPVYICETPQGIYGFNLSSMEEPVWESRGMPKTSHFNQRQFVTKEVGYFHISKSKHYE